MQPSIRHGAIARRRIRLLTATGIIALWAIISLTFRASINGQSVSTIPAPTVAKCASRLGIQTEPGDLLDVRGNVIKRGGGTPTGYIVNGVSVPAAYRVHRGDSVEITPATNRTENVIQSATFITPAAATADGPKQMPWFTESGVGGIKYVTRGEISGQIDSIQLAALSPTKSRAPGPRRVALTFDDGPSQYTPQILDILRKHGARATFFLIGYSVSGGKNTIRRAVAEGHEIAGHSWSHPDLTRLSAGAIRGQLQRWENSVEPLIGGRARNFRPPYGAINKTARSVINSMGYRVILWTADTNDWRKPGSGAIYSRAMRGARDGAIILMHDGGGNRAQTVAAVRKIVPDLQARGYELVTVSELFEKADPWQNEMIVHTESGDLELVAADDDLQVKINGEYAELPVKPVKIDGQWLLPAKPTVPALGCGISLDKAAMHITIKAPLQQIEMDLNKRMMTVGKDEIFMAVPAVFYRGNSMIPLWVLVDYCGASAVYDAASKTLYIKGKYSLPLSPVEGSYIPNEPPQLPVTQSGLSVVEN